MEIFRSRLPSPFELPKQIVRLGELAYNLWWTWHPEAVRLFGRIDYDLWERLGHNPIVYLRELRRTRLKRAADNKDYLSQYDNVMNEFDEYLIVDALIEGEVEDEKSNEEIINYLIENGIELSTIINQL